MDMVQLDYDLARVLERQSTRNDLIQLSGDLSLASTVISKREPLKHFSGVLR